MGEVGDLFVVVGEFVFVVDEFVIVDVYGFVLVWFY